MRKEFKVHLLNEQGIQTAQEMAQKFSDLADWVHSVSDSSPELTITVRKLEEACFYAKKAMAQNPSNQKKDL